MLIIKRRERDVITIAPLEGTDTSRPIDELFRDGVIEIKLLEVGRKQVKVAIDAPRQLQIWRGRMDEKPVATVATPEPPVEDATDVV